MSIHCDYVQMARSIVFFYWQFYIIETFLINKVINYNLHALDARFFLDLDIAAPKISIPTDFCPDNTHSTKLLLDLGNLVIRTQVHWETSSSIFCWNFFWLFFMKNFSEFQDDSELTSPDEMNLYLQFDLVLSDVSAFLVDGDYHWSEPSLSGSAGSSVIFLPVIDKCGVILNLQQVLSGSISLSILTYFVFISL